MLNFLKTYPKFYTKSKYFRQFNMKRFCTGSDNSNIYTTKIMLKENDYEELWQNTKPFLKIKENRINFTEFKIIIDNVHVLIDFWKFAEGNFKNKPIRTFLESTFYDSNNNLGQKFTSNSTNWSTLYENIEKISYLIDKNDIVKSRLNVYLKDTLELYLFEHLHRLQDNESFTNEDIKEFSLSKTDFDRLKFNTDLSFSLFNYLKDSERINKKQNENLSFFVVKIGLIFIEKFLLMNKSSIKYLEKNADKKNNEILSYLFNIENYIENLMKNYKNFDSIPDFKKGDFFKIFSFYESKWLNSAKWLLNTNLNELNIHHYNLFIYAAKGSIRFENFDYFEKLIANLNQLSNYLNISTKVYSNLSLLFGQFFNTLMTQKNNKNLDNLLDVWAKIDYVPNQVSLSNLNYFLNHLNSRSKDNKYNMEKVKIGNNGKLFDSNLSLKKFKYNSDAMVKISELIKSNILSAESLKNEKLDELKKIDTMLAENKFDFVIDGMNIVFLKHNSNNFYNLINLIEILNTNFRNKKCLIFIRDHVHSKNKNLIKKIMDANHKKEGNNKMIFYCLDSIFEDDKFFLYSAVKSNENTLLISNDYFSNHTHFLNEYGGVFREWLFNRKVITNLSLKRIYLPPRYQLKCTKIATDKWILPYLNDINNPRNHSFVLIEKNNKNKIY